MADERYGTRDGEHDIERVRLGMLASARDPATCALLDRVGLLSELESDDEPFTIFVPTNDAIEALRNSADAPDFDNDEVVRELFEAHIVRGEALDAAAMAAAGEVVVSNGGPQPVDASTDPITVGGVEVTVTDSAVDGGIVHVLDGVFSFQP